MLPQHRDAEVAVIGGGPAGATTARALARAGIPVALIERGLYAGWKIGEGVPPAATPVLQRLGVWERFLADEHLPSYGNASAWGAPELATQSFIFDPYSRGWHLDRQRFDRMLACAGIEAGACHYPGTTVLAARQIDGNRWELHLTSGAGASEVLTARFVVDASGRASWIAARQGARRINDDGLVGVAARLATDQDLSEQDTSTLVEAVPDGWWYSAPIPGARLVVAYMTDGNNPLVRAARTRSGWLALLARTRYVCEQVVRFRYRIEIAPMVFAASSAHLDRVIGGSWLAVGDAAIAFDPLSSQGILTALLAGRQASAAIIAHFDGGAGALDHYARFIDQTYAEYLRNRSAYYAMEQRWPTSPFWRRRHLRAQAL